MKKYLLRLKIDDEMLIETCHAQDKNEALMKFIGNHLCTLNDYDEAYISQGISLITEDV